MTPEMRAVMAALRGQRLPLEDEKQTQAAIEAAFHKAWTVDGFRAWPPIQREADIGCGVIDFLIGSLGGFPGTGVEVKLKGTPEGIRKQLRRYALSPRIEGLVLVTAKPVGLVQMMAGKPVVEFDIARAWL